MLTDAKVRNAKAADKPQKLTNSHGLYLYITPNGTKTWRIRYALGGKEQVLTLGQYPAMGLSDARSTRLAARTLIKEGKNPKELRNAPPPGIPPERTFEVIARQWFDLQKAKWTAVHAKGVLDSPEDVFPMTSRVDRPISENAIGYLLNRAGYHSRHVPHGWRATFSSVMNERFQADRMVIAGSHQQGSYRGCLQPGATLGPQA